MAETKQDMLRSAWLGAKDGGLSGREQAKAGALREVWRGDGKVDADFLFVLKGWTQMTTGSLGKLITMRWDSQQ